MWRVGVDVGGTFTDLFAWEEETGKRVTAKVLTTKSDRSEGVIQAVEAADIPFAEISHLIHGTTAATNALLERSFPDAAMITTDGFRDTIEIGRQHRKHLYDPYQTKPRPIIKRRYRYTVPERMNVKGEADRPLDKAAARAVVEKIADAGIKSIAIAFINAYVNDAHEQQMRDIVREILPDAHVVLSGETRPVFREHGRFSTTAIRAALMPVMVEFFDRLQDRLKEKGFSGSLLILKSSGGVAGVDLAKDHPEELLESGPAGGVAYAAYLSRLTDYDNFIHTDMGGTSFEASIVEHGKGLVTRDYELEWEIPVTVPMLDIHSVGAGGGSIGWVDEGGSLRVGPRSVGSEPGPACYGRGGTEASITDANLLLGRLEPTLGGKMTLDRDAAEKAVEKLAQQVGLSTLETAEGMIKISCENMAQAVKMVLLDRGRDPRDFVLTSFGGAGAMHASFVADAMSIPKVIVPSYAGVASAFGATAMDLRQDLEAFMYAPIDSVDLDAVNDAYKKLENDARELLVKDGADPARMAVTRTAQMRYVGQTYEVETPIPEGTLSEKNIAEIAQAFHEQHRLEYGVSSDDFQPALVSVCVTATGKTDAPPPANDAARDGKNAHKGERQVYFDGNWYDAPVLNGEAIASDSKIIGPAIIEYDDACAVLRPQSIAHMDDMRNLVIDLKRAKPVTATIKDQIDPVTFEVLRNTFEYTCTRMATVLQKSSFSPVLAEMVDFSNAIYDADLQLLSQAANCPVHLAAMKFSAEAVLERFGPDDISEGDVFVLNDPYQGGTHIPDITFTMPVFNDGVLLGYAVSRGHWMDLGGGAPGGYAWGNHITTEGLRLPPLKIFRNGEINEDLVAIILNNTRTPHFVRGDLQAHLGALRAAESELCRAAERYGIDTVTAAMKQLQAYTERIVRKSIERIPDGEYEAEDYADTDGFSENITVKVKLTIKGSEILVDFAGSDPQCEGAINSPYANTASAVLYSLQFFLAPEVPQNQGMFNPISIKLPDDCWLNAKWPAPTIGCTTITSSKITSAIWQALANAIPEQVTGSTFADCNGLFAAVRDEAGQSNVFADLPAGGWGGTPFNDGMNVTQDPLGNCMNLPAEVAELLFPVAYESFELRKDSAGSGRYRGGVGAVFKVRFLGNAEVGMETARTKEGSPGVNGGQRSTVQRLTRIGADESTEVIGGLTHNGQWINPLIAGVPFKAGETFMFESTGGGGWGDPYERPPGDVMEDVLDEYISIETAQRDYGVVIDSISMALDEDATAKTRESRQ